MATPLEQAIDAATQDKRERLIMRVAALLEGGSLSGPWPAGDNGKSFGPFQIYTTAHPDVTPAQASDPAFAVGYMLPQFRAAIAKIESSRWVTAPFEAIAEAIYYAERPAAPYPIERDRAAIQAVRPDLTGDPGDGTGVGQGTQETPTGNPVGDAISNAINAILGGYLAQLRAFWTAERLIRVAVVIIGAILLVEGVVFVAAPAVGRAAGAVAGA